MPYTAITKPAQGSGTLKSLIDAVIDNLAYLYNLIGGSGAGSSDYILNGSFENDSDSDGVPDNWAVTLFSGGSSGIYAADQAHGGVCYRFVSTGSGGGYMDTEDCITCAEGVPVAIRFALKSTVPDVHNVVQLLWYDDDKTACGTSYTSIYDDASNNPTSWNIFTRAAVPPSTARYYKVRLIGCHSDYNTAGETLYDAVEAIQEALITPAGQISESSRKCDVGADYADSGSMTITLPSLSTSSIVEISIIGQLRTTSGGIAYQRFRVGAYYSNGVSTSSTSYVYAVQKIVAYGLSGSQTIYQQIYDYTEEDPETVYGKVDPYSVVAKILKH